MATKPPKKVQRVQAGPGPVDGVLFNRAERHLADAIDGLAVQVSEIVTEAQETTFDASAITTGVFDIARLPEYDGDVTSSGTSLALARIPAHTPVLGELSLTVATPSTPPSGKASLYTDGSVLAIKNDAGVITHTVKTKLSSSHLFLAGILDDGTVQTAQPSYADLTGNTGSTPGRPGVEVLIDSVSASGASSYTSPSLAGYSRIRWEYKRLGGTATTGALTLSGLGSTRRQTGRYMSGGSFFDADNPFITFDPGVLGVNTGEFLIESGGLRLGKFDYADSNNFMGHFTCSYADTTNAVSALVIAWSGGTATYAIKIWGVPS